MSSEQFKHQAIMINEHLILAHGRFSHECEDYCNSMWQFYLIKDTQKEVNHDKTTCDYYPRRQQRFSIIGDTKKQVTTSMFLFIGH